MINKIFFLGDVVKGPSKRTATNGGSVTYISLKQEKGVNPNTGKKESIIIPVLFFAGLADQVAIMVSKGMKVMVEGNLNIRYFIDKEKKAHQYTEIIGKHITYIDGTQSKKLPPNEILAKLKPQFEQLDIWGPLGP